MGFKKVNKEFSVWLKEDFESFPKGTCLHVEKESAHLYQGIQTSPFGTCYAKFPKEKCTKKNPLKTLLEDVSKFLKTKEGQEISKKMESLIKKR